MLLLCKLVWTGENKHTYNDLSYLHAISLLSYQFISSECFNNDDPAIFTQNLSEFFVIYLFF